MKATVLGFFKGLGKLLEHRFLLLIVGLAVTHAIGNDISEDYQNRQAKMEIPA